MTSPRITALSWHAWCSSTGSAGSPDGTKLTYDAAAGSARGTSMMSMPRQLSGSSPGSGDPKVVLADALL